MNNSLTLFVDGAYQGRVYDPEYDKAFVVGTTGEEHLATLAETFPQNIYFVVEA